MAYLRNPIGKTCLTTYDTDGRDDSSIDNKSYKSGATQYAIGHCSHVPKPPTSGWRLSDVSYNAEILDKVRVRV